MTNALRRINPFDTSVNEILKAISPLLRMVFPLHIAVVIGLLAYNFDETPMGYLLAALVLIVTASIPVALWTSGRVGGLPIVPAIAAGDIIWFAMPIVRRTGEMAHYDLPLVWKAVTLEVLFLGTMTFIWMAMMRKPAPVPQELRMIPARTLRPERMAALWLVVFSLGVAFTVSVATRWIDPWINRMPAGVYPLLRTFAGTATVAAALFIGLAIGMRKLSPIGHLLFIALFSTFWLASCKSLILVSVVPVLLPLLAGLLLGSGRVPWKTLIVSFLLLQVLHAGKAQMRDRYWSAIDGRMAHISPAQWPAFYAEWWNAGLRGLFDPIPGTGNVELLTRTSIVQMVLYAQERAPDHVPYLGGDTLVIIPKLFIPRIVWAAKPRTHEGQVMLNLHFGRQDEESAQRTYIAWGMLAEFYANFGMLGGLLLGVSLGSLFGFVSRHTARVPTTSLRFLIAVPLFIGGITATQMAASVWVTAMFQSSMALLIAGMFLMKKHPVTPSVSSPSVAPSPEAVAA